MRTIEQVLEFHQLFDMPFATRPGMHGWSETDAIIIGRMATEMENMAEYLHGHMMNNKHGDLVLRTNLMVEELGELLRAMAEDDKVEALDALCDLRYVADGTAHALGMGEIFHEAFDEVHRTNMAKAPGGVVERDAAGRIQKPEGWTKPDLARILGD